MSPVHCRLGEGIIRDAERGCIWWVDIEGQLLHRSSYDGNHYSSLEFDQKVSMIALSTHHTLLVGLEREIREIDEHGHRIRSTAFEPDCAHTRANDGKVGPDGALWIGSMSSRMRSGEAALYRLDQDFQLRTVLTGVTVSNGMGWSPDGTCMYYIDTTTRRIDAFSFDPAGDGMIPQSRHCITAIPPELGWPDGMAVDSQGNLWVAMYDGSCITVWDPADGHLLDRIDLPVRRITSLAFGGDALCDLYITTAAADSAGEQQDLPLSGRLLHLTAQQPGLPGYLFGRRQE
ncbi:SMP-30/gluconolactonase/LRE family protein [Spirochaeta africana]|uniref:SMP-30/gluconolactonase/LRE family protein n=1 Tax=Spirochaeta africana TaxID=46355 RepID=UPI00145D1BF3|nr:SMP-30/gluconolactonase/LRE family protein [Spirochaeta africana]